jgi:hypothetical protein
MQNRRSLLVEGLAGGKTTNSPLLSFSHPVPGIHTANDGKYTTSRGFTNTSQKEFVKKKILAAPPAAIPERLGDSTFECHCPKNQLPFFVLRN